MYIPTRMRIVSAFLLALVTLVLVTGCVKADPKAEARKAIQSGYDAENAAMARKDAAGTLAFHSPDYIAIVKNRQSQSRGKDIETFADVFRQPNTSWKRTTLIREFTPGNAQVTEATVTVNHHAEMLMLRPESDQRGTLIIDTVERDYWVKGAQGWQIKRSNLLQAKTKHDIKPPGSL